MKIATAPYRFRLRSFVYLYQARIDNVPIMFSLESPSILFRMLSLNFFILIVDVFGS